MLRRKILGLIAVLGALATSACAPQVIAIPQPGYAPVPAPAYCDTRFQVVNNSSRTVLQLFFSHSSIQTWGVDQLGQNVLPPGRVWSYRANNPGDYDFRVVWAGGGAAELRRVNICRAARIYMTNRGLYAE